MTITEHYFDLHQFQPALILVKYPALPVPADIRSRYHSCGSASIHIRTANEVAREIVFSHNSILLSFRHEITANSHLPGDKRH